MDTIAAIVERDRWVALLRRSGLDFEQVGAVLASDAFGPLCAALRRAEDAGYKVDVLVPVLVGRRALLDADDMAAVLHHRVVAAMDRRRRAADPAVDARGRARGISPVVPADGQPAWNSEGGRVLARQRPIELD